MLIKVGKFNFLNDKKYIIDLDEYNLSGKLFGYFYIDNKDDVLYVDSKEDFDRKLKNNEKFENELSEKFSVVDYYRLAKENIEHFIEKKAMERYETQNYSRYDLYSYINVYKLSDLYNAKKTETDIRFFGTNVLTDCGNVVIKTSLGENLTLNLYSNEVENLETVYNRGYFEKYINEKIKTIEFNNNKAPAFIYEIMKIMDFLKDKKTVNLIFNDNEKIKVDAKLGNIFDIYNNKIELAIRISSNYGKNVEDLKAISNGNKFLEINSNNFINTKEQIATTIKDKVKFKLKDVESDLNSEYYKYYDSLREKSYYRDMPLILNEAVSRITSLESYGIENIRYPEWYSEDIKNMVQISKMIEIIEESNESSEIKQIAEDFYKLRNDKETANLLLDYSNEMDSNKNRKLEETMKFENNADELEDEEEF